MENRVKAILKEKGLRMSDLASRVGMGQSNLVASLRNNPKLSTLEDICRALGIEMAELFGGNAQKGDGILILGGKTFAVMKPAPRTVQLPSYSDYAVLRNDIKRFVKARIADQSAGSLCGIVEDFEFFTLTYDHDDNAGSQGVLYEKFTLTICYGYKQIWVHHYDLYEYSLGGEEKWDIPMVIEEIINDIEGYAITQLDTTMTTPAETEKTNL